MHLKEERLAAVKAARRTMGEARDSMVDIQERFHNTVGSYGSCVLFVG